MHSKVLVLGSKLEQELGSKQVLELVHNKLVLVHSKVLELGSSSLLCGIRKGQRQRLVR